jgi:hypothetical protein
MMLSSQPRESGSLCLARYPMYAIRRPLPQASNNSCLSVSGGVKPISCNIKALNTFYLLAPAEGHLSERLELPG